MITLNLSPDCVERPTLMEVWNVEAMMIWPDDPEARDRWITAACMEANSSLIDDLPLPLLRQFAKNAWREPRLDELRGKMGKRQEHGRISGHIVLNAIEQELPLGTVRENIAEALGGTFQITPGTMNNEIVPRYRPVAHFWAAFVFEARDGNDAWPCSVPGLLEFLATAEAIRKLAETSKVHKANATIMRPGDAVALPPKVAARLPKVEMQRAS